jgi:hypothetical protein
MWRNFVMVFLMSSLLAPPALAQIDTEVSYAVKTLFSQAYGYSWDEASPEVQEKFFKQYNEQVLREKKFDEKQQEYRERLEERKLKDKENQIRRLEMKKRRREKEAERKAREVEMEKKRLEKAMERQEKLIDNQRKKAERSRR